MQIWKPMIATVNGYCLAAGLTLLSACDLRIAAEHTQFGLPEVVRGIVPTLGATQRLTRQLPWSVVMEPLLLGERIYAQRALSVGLINCVMPSRERDADRPRLGRTADRGRTAHPSARSRRRQSAAYRSRSTNASAWRSYSPPTSARPTALKKARRHRHSPRNARQSTRATSSDGRPQQRRSSVQPDRFAAS